jgi:UrcA family protein
MVRPNRSILLASLACAFLTPPAHSDEPAVHPDEPAAKRKLIARVHVAYDGLDIQKESDARVMLERLRRAAYHACGGNPRLHRTYDVMPRRTVAAFRECREEALCAAIAEINSPTLTRISRIDNGQH